MDGAGRVSEQFGGAAALVGIEFVVEDLDRAVAVWVDVLGFELAASGPSSVVPGQMAIVTDGQVAVTLLQPDAVGPGDLLTDRSPRLTQVVLTAQDPSRVSELASEAGLSVVPTSSGCYLAPESVAGVMGLEVAVVVTRTDVGGPTPPPDEPG